MRGSENPLVVLGASRSITVDARIATQTWASRTHGRDAPIRRSTRPTGFAVRSYAIGNAGGAVCGLLVRNRRGVGAPDSLPTHYLIAVGDQLCSVRPIAQVFCP
jgi:hypothetical protein